MKQSRRKGMMSILIQYFPVSQSFRVKCSVKQGSDKIYWTYVMSDMVIPVRRGQPAPLRNLWTAFKESLGDYTIYKKRLCYVTLLCGQRPNLPTWISFNPWWISNHLHGKVWDVIICLIPNINGANFEAWEWIIKFIQHFIMGLIT